MLETGALLIAAVADMEAGSPRSAGSRRGGSDLCTAQESREESGRSRGGTMRARVCARVRTPHGVGALLLVGGAIVGAAVVAWRRRGDRRNAKNHHRDKEQEKVLDGGVVENEQGKLDKSDEDLSRGVTEVEANGLFQDRKKTEELQEIQEKVDEIVPDELDTGHADKFDPSPSRECTEIIDDMGRGDMKKADQNSSKSGVENEIMPNPTEDVENSDESTLSISDPEIAHGEHNRHEDRTEEETASTQITPVTHMTAHQPQISDDVKVESMMETAVVNTVSKQEEQKPGAQDPVTPVDSPACSSLPSLLKTAQKKKPVNPGQNETGMKLGQDCSNSELSKGGAAQGAAMVTTNRRATSMVILAIIFAMTIGLNLVVRLYSTLQAT